MQLNYMFFTAMQVQEKVLSVRCANAMQLDREWLHSCHSPAHMGLQLSEWKTAIERKYNGNVRGDDGSQGIKLLPEALDREVIPKSWEDDNGTFCQGHKCGI